MFREKDIELHSERSRRVWCSWFDSAHHEVSASLKLIKVKLWIAKL